MLEGSELKADREVRGGSTVESVLYDQADDPVSLGFAAHGDKHAPGAWCISRSSPTWMHPAWRLDGASRDRLVPLPAPISGW